MPLIGPVSGSHTHLGDGSSYLVAGSNVTITSGTGEAVTIAASGGGGISFDGSTANGVLTFKDSDEATVESNLTFDGTDLGVAAKVFHIGDTDTFIEFTDDDINLQAGGVNFIDITQDTQNEITFNEAGADIDFRVESSNEDEAIFLNAGTNELHINKGNSAFATSIHGNNGNALEVNSSGVVINEPGNSANDFRVETNNKTHGLFVDSGNDRVLILSGGATTSTNSAAKSDIVFFVSGAVGGKTVTKTGVTVFGGDLVSSGIMYAPNVQVGDSGVGFPMTTALNVYANVSSDFAAKIDNDQSSAGHILKLSTDGNGSGTTMMAMEDGDGDTLFKARADGRFGFGASGVSSMGAGTFVVGIDGGHTSDLAISKRLQHLGDSNTFMDFPQADAVNFQAGGVEMLTMFESNDEGMVLVLSGGASSDPNVLHAEDVNFFVSGTKGSRSSTIRGTSVFGGDVLSSGSLHVLGSGANFESSVSNSPLVNIKNTTDDTSAARLRFTKDKGSAGADGDDIGSIEFVGDDANQDQVTFVQIMAEVSEADNGSEGGKLSFGVASHDGEMVTAMSLEDGEAEDEVLTTINAPVVAVNSVTADGATLDPAKGFHAIMNGTGGTVATTLADATAVGKLVVITNISSGGATTVAYGAPDGSTVTKTLSNGSQGLLLISVSTGAAIKWIKLGDVS